MYLLSLQSSKMMGLKVIITGATGMVGEGVMLECIANDYIKEILLIVRKPSGVAHPKVKEIVHSNFFDIGPIAGQLKGYDACYFCLGVSSIGMKEPEFHKMSYELTRHCADVMAAQNTGMVFCYVSGAGTDSTEKGKTMWARVKGKIENYLLQHSQLKGFMFRPGYMHPTPGAKNTLKGYKYITWMYPLLKHLMPNSTSTLADLGRAMIAVTVKGSDNKILEVKDIKMLSKEL